MGLRSVWYLVRETFDGWARDRVARLAAAVAFYTVFSLAPLLIISVGLVDIVISQMTVVDIMLPFDQTGVITRIAAQVRDLIGPRGEDLVRTILEESRDPSTGIAATVVGLVTLLIGATGVFAELQGALNKVWKVEPQAAQGIMSIVRTRLLSFAMVLIIGFLLLVSLIISALLTALDDYLTGLVPGSIYLMRLLNLVISIGFITFLFGLIFRYLPDARITWRDVWVGAAVTAVFFTIGKTLIGLYLGNAPFGAAYGAAGSLAVILVWVYFSCQIVLIGAEFTHVYARRYGSQILSMSEARASADQPVEPPDREGSVANF